MSLGGIKSFSLDTQKQCIIAMYLKIKIFMQIKPLALEGSWCYFLQLLLIFSVIDLYRRHESELLKSPAYEVAWVV